MEIGSVVTTDNTKVINDNCAVAQQVDASIVIKLLSILFSAIKFMIAQTGIDGCRQTMELLCHFFFFQWVHAHVDNITGNKYHVRLLIVNHVYPAMELLTWIMIADMQVADHHQFHRTCQMLVGGQRQLLAIFMLIVQVAIDKDGYHHHSDA